MSEKAPQPSEYATHDEWLDALDAWECDYCHELGLDFQGPVPMSNGERHGAGMFCRHCGMKPRGHWVEKLRSPSEAKSRRPHRGKRRKAATLGTDKCAYCGWTRDELKAIGEELHEAHDDAYGDLVDAGVPDDPDRHYLLCTTDHRIQELNRARAERIRYALSTGPT